MADESAAQSMAGESMAGEFKAAKYSLKAVKRWASFHHLKCLWQPLERVQAHRRSVESETQDARGSESSRRCWHKLVQSATL